MSREHFELRSWKKSAPKGKKSRWPPPVARDNKQAHAETLVSQSEKLAEELNRRKREANTILNPKFIFKIQLDEKGYLSDDAVRLLQLKLIEETQGKALVVFPDEATLQELQSRLRQHAGLEEGSKYARLTNIEAIVPIEPEDRIGPNLRLEDFGENEVVALDLSLWHPGTTEVAEEWVKEIETVISEKGGRASDKYIGNSLCLVRIHVKKDLVEFLLEQDVVKQVDRRPTITFPLNQLGIERENYVVSDDKPSPDAAGIVIVDSGIQQNHPVIRNALGDAQKFPNNLLGSVNDVNGHGTAVAGIALYGDVQEHLEKRRFEPEVQLFSARVLDENNNYDEEMLVENQLASAVKYFIDNYPNARVFNLSLGNDQRVFSEKLHQSPLATVIDELAYLYRDENILFVVPTGNYSYGDLEQMAQDYPNYLLEDNARIIDPATSALAVTVGGLSAGLIRERRLNKDAVTLISKKRNFPSSLTRSGFGFGKAIKPEFVDYSGCLLLQKYRSSGENPLAGILSINTDLIGGNPFKMVHGTSFAAPKIANIIARLKNAFPDASSNLIRAFLVESARLPKKRPDLFKDNASEETLRIYGYGQPDYERVSYSTEQNVLLLRDDKQEVDTFRIFELPTLPDSFFTHPGKGHLSVSLAYDPPTRATRQRDYLGTKMAFKIYRNISPDEIDSAFGRGDESSISAISKYEVGLTPGTNRRGRGTLQYASCSIATTRWKYEGYPLYLVVECRSAPWLDEDINHQRFAAIVAYRHDSEEILLHQHVHQRNRHKLYQRARTRIRI